MRSTSLVVRGGARCLLAAAVVLSFAASAAPQASAATDAAARLALVRAAAQKADLQDVGLDWHDLYGVIHAESGWVGRDGLGRNGVVSRGIAQFEPATAKAVGLQNPNDPAQAVQAAAVLLHEAAQWSARKLQGVPLAPGEWAVRLREGVSVYYNLSSRARSAWNGMNSQAMPRETRLHIRNARAGALIAAKLDAIPVPSVPVVAAAPRIVPVDVGIASARKPRPVRTAGPAVAVRVPTVTVAGIPNLHRTQSAMRLPQGMIEWSRS
ncbi:MAG TPA: hypothetical protein VHA82_12625 [Ramlibacter sp.]|uniref:hypothetical protein n=1 Tax=Ramlibacter sp. TaxID=1917967 RepID=UPI002B9465ED|nr:hypothetical protein [Ramlibacter sp.]HVZ44646.1 hypothetical protein [Ramlibacter sp.]